MDEEIKALLDEVSTPERFCSSWPEQKCSSDASNPPMNEVLSGDRLTVRLPENQKNQKYALLDAGSLPLLLATAIGVFIK